jgi:putative sugar O-methyltransferase
MPDQDETEKIFNQYYVGKCGKPGFGTSEQLQQGILERSQMAGSGEILERVIRAWHEMARTSVAWPEAYRVGGEWLPIIERAFPPLIKALDRKDTVSLDQILGNFFRLYGDYFGEPTDFLSQTNTRFRCERFRVYSSRWMDLYGERSLPEVRSPRIGNPAGFMIDGMLFTHGSFVHNHYARRVEDLCSDINKPVVCEIGGGWGGFAYHLFSRSRRFKYIDYDIPLIASIAAYYLLTAFPQLRIGLFGEIDDLAHPADKYDLVVLPNHAIRSLEDRGADVCFNSCSFAEMDEMTVREYISQFERVCRKFILHENHAWTSGSSNSAYRPLGGFKHWDLSQLEPSSERFQRLYKIPAPFHGDFRGEFFEWLYVRK